MVNLLDGPPDIITVVEASEWQKAALGHDFHRGEGLDGQFLRLLPAEDRSERIWEGRNVFFAMELR